jgi:preprotein translocase subunit SecG
MLTVIIVIHLMLVLALIGVVLLQKSEGGGLVSSGGSGFLTGRGTANVLTRTTALLAAGFFVTSLALSWLASFQRHPASIINTGGPVQEAPGGPAPAPPLNAGNGDLLNQLQKGIPGLPAGPNSAGSAPAPVPGPAPSGPQVPQSQ